MTDIPMPILLILTITSIISYIIVKLHENAEETNVEYIADKICEEENNLNTVAEKLQDISYLEINGNTEELAELLGDVKTSFKLSDYIIYDSDRSTWMNSSSSNPSIPYNCPYCGTHYIANTSGFIPNCKNCGATMEKE